MLLVLANCCDLVAEFVASLVFDAQRCSGCCWFSDFIYHTPARASICANLCPSVAQKNSAFHRDYLQPTVSNTKEKTLFVSKTEVDEIFKLTNKIAVSFVPIREIRVPFPVSAL
jgi:hypothetical protein